jgi:thymidylate kinase
MTRGKLIVIEGLDGSGKQTQSELLWHRLIEAGFCTMKVSFPAYDKESSILVKKYLKGDYKQSNSIDRLTYIKQMSTFYAVDRVSSFIETAGEGCLSLVDLLNGGTHIICDRYTTSNILHQTGNLGQDHAAEYIDWMHDLEYNHLGLPRPDLVLYLDVKPQISIENMKKRYAGGEGKDIHENLDHLSRVYSMKDFIINYAGWTRVNCCTFGDKLLPIETISEFVMQHVYSLLTDEPKQIELF